MTSQLVKFRLRSELGELEVEGSKTDVDALVERWWPTLESTNANPKSAQPLTPIDPAAASKVVRAPKPVVEAAEGGEVDATAVANAIKEHDLIDIFTKKILTERDTYRKVALVSWIAQRPLTSGGIQSVLDALGVKILTRNISKVLDREKSKFKMDGVRKSGGTPVRYQLTLGAKKDFEAWLSANA